MADGGGADGGGAGKPVIFISYCHKDEPLKPGEGEVAWLTYIQSFLQPAVKNGVFDLWVDEHIPGGDEWEKHIKSQLAVCDICILLVSRHSLNSHYCIDIEVEAIAQRRSNGDDVQIYPIVLTPVPQMALTPISHLNPRPKDWRALSTFSHSDRDVVTAKIADEIANMLAGKKAVEHRAAKPERSMPPGFVHISGLPETPYEKLVGRDTELQRLDDAWSQHKVNIVSLIAEGGAGKSALTNEWLARLQTDNYRGAEAVLGWSFYSQGSKERATSSEGFLDWALAKLDSTRAYGSASAKGEAIAEALMARRVLLVLDGIEPLQHGTDGQLGLLKDDGLRGLLRRFAATPPAAAHGLIVLTSRLAVTNIARWKEAAPVIDVERLSEEAGAALLRDNGVWGTDMELKAASREFGGHPLALGLLASLLAETQVGDVRRRDHVGKAVLDGDDPRHAHARRVMRSYESEWLDDRPELRAIMHLVGLFDRPASGDCLAALRARPAIAGLTETLVDLDDGAWQRAVARLRAVRLLAPLDPSAPDALDAHPLVREWFGERFRATDETAWRAAHGRLYEHLRDTTREGVAPTLEDLAPLYQAIAHGCRAGRHREALYDVDVGRICRRRADGKLEFYAANKLGALGSDLAAISWFFAKPYATPVEALTEADRSWVLSEAARSLCAQGRFAEALPALRAGLPALVAREDWRNAAIRASNLSETDLLVGAVDDAVADGETAVAHADRSGDAFHVMSKRTAQAGALQAAGRRAEAETLFAEAERRQREWQPEYPLLYSLQGYQYCDLLLGKGEWATARERAEKTLEWVKSQDWRLDTALDTLTLGRAALGLALEARLRAVQHPPVIPAQAGTQGHTYGAGDVKHWVPAGASARAARSADPGTGTTKDGAGTNGDKAAPGDDAAPANEARTRLDQAVEGLRGAGTTHHIARGLLARAAFRRGIGDWAGAARDLDEVEEIAEPGPMRLYLCDLALERARLALAMSEAFAPLNGMLAEDNPPAPNMPDAERVAELKRVAGEQIKIAADTIETCRYHRRDEERDELRAVLRGEKTFADLPPRV